MGYLFKPIEYNLSSLRKYTDLLNFVFKEKIPKTVEFLDWEYNKNPLGRAYGFDAFYKNELVAHYSAQPINCYIEGEKKKGLLALHVATLPAHRGKGLFSVINNKTHEKAFNEGYDFVIGVANKNSMPRYVKSLGFKLLTQLNAKIGFGFPVRNFKYGEYSFKRIWNRDSLNWRLKDPSYPHQIVKKSETINVIAPTHINLINAVVYQTIENQFDNFTPFKKIYVSPIKVWLGIDKLMKWKYSIDIPDKFRPSPLNLIYLNLTNNNHILDKDNILFNNIDFDAF